MLIHDPEDVPGNEEPTIKHKATCKRCGRITVRQHAQCWFDYGVCPQCFQSNDFASKSLLFDLPLTPIIIQRVPDPVEDYHNWVTREWLRTNTI